MTTALPCPFVSKFEHRMIDKHTLTDSTAPSSHLLSNTNEVQDDASQEPCPDSAAEANPAVLERRLNRASWWQKCMVQRSVPAIQASIQATMERSAFFQREPLVDTTKIALFHQHEIQTGRLLGTGGFSEVYEINGFVLDPTVSERCTVQQLRLRQKYAAGALGSSGWGRYALKHLKKTTSTHMAQRDFHQAATDLVMESAYMSRLHHPHIAPIRGLPIDGVAAWSDGDLDGYFLITDRLDGTLGDRIKQWKHGVAEAPGFMAKMRYAQQIASALHYLHSEHRIVFRDLKPQNMGFVAESKDEVQLFDFGLCCELPPCTQVVSADESDLEQVYAMSGVGTRRYIAPEVVNNGRYNTKVDVYSWALVTWELVSGIRPFSTYNTDDHRIAVCQQGERPRLYMHWPEWFQLLLRRTWCETVADRWSMSQVVSYLHQATRPHGARRTGCPASPVGVCELDEVVFANSANLTIPDLDISNVSIPRRISLNPRPSREDTSSLVLQGRLLVLTLCIDEAIEVCAHEAAWMATPVVHLGGVVRMGTRTH
jgi:serine/threonine protein kinase